jgi:DNA recombination protein Rad52
MTTETPLDDDFETTDDGGGTQGNSAHFAPDQLDMLNKRLDRALIKSKQGKSYIEGFVAINTANRIFGYGSWSHRVDEHWTVETDGNVLYCALVTITVIAPNGTRSTHQDLGSSVAARSKETSKISIESHETAIKGAVTDALKRALRAYGEQWANNLYDKDYMRNREEEERVAREELVKRDKYAKAVMALEAEKIDDGETTEIRKQFLTSKGMPYVAGVNNWASDLLVEYGRFLRGLASKEKAVAS